MIERDSRTIYETMREAVRGSIDRSIDERRVQKAYQMILGQGPAGGIRSPNPETPGQH